MGCHIQIRDLALSYSWKNYTKSIFEDLNLCIEKGSFVSIVGGNGSGKSSLVKLILGLSAPDRGEVIVDGQTVKPGYPEAIRDHRIAYMAQQIEELFFAETVREELSYAGVSSDEELNQILDGLGLWNFLDRSIESLSGGERQGLALAQFMMHKARLLILDEPSSYLDWDRAEFLRNFLLQVNSSGKTIIHVTQYPAEITWGTHVIDLNMPELKVARL